MHILPGSSSEGEARKRAAQQFLEVHRGRLILRGRRALLAHLLAHQTATIDDVRRAVPVPAALNPKAFGAVPGPLAAANVIRATGFAKTGRPVGHARPVTVWELADPPAAPAWLIAHPDLPHPD